MRLASLPNPRRTETIARGASLRPMTAGRLICPYTSCPMLNGLSVAAPHLRAPPRFKKQTSICSRRRRQHGADRVLEPDSGGGEALCRPVGRHSPDRLRRYPLHDLPSRHHSLTPIAANWNPLRELPLVLPLHCGGSPPGTLSHVVLRSAGRRRESGTWSRGNSHREALHNNIQNTFTHSGTTVRRAFQPSIQTSRCGTRLELGPIPICFLAWPRSVRRRS